MKNSIFARFARAVFIFWHFEDVLVLSTTWNDLFCSCVDDVSIWWQMFNFVCLCPKPWFQFNSGIVRAHFSSTMTLNNWKINCRNARLYFQMTFSLPSTSCFLKLPINCTRTFMQINEIAKQKLLTRDSQTWVQTTFSGQPLIIHVTTLIWLTFRGVCFIKKFKLWWLYQCSSRCYRLV